MRKFALVASLFLLPLSCPALSQALQTHPRQVTADDVIALHNAGIADDIVITRIRMHNDPAELSTDQLIQLKQAHIPDVVVRALLDPASPSTSAPAASVVTVQNAAQDVRANLNPSGATPGLGGASVGDPDDPRAPHDSGIYLQAADADGKLHLLPVEKTSIAGAKFEGAFSVNIIANLSRKQAPLRTRDGSATFFFYFDNKSAGLDQTVPGEKASNPDGFLLLHLKAEKNSRTVVLGHMSIGNMSHGPKPDVMSNFTSVRLAPGLYKVTADKLLPGEYAFVRTTDLAAMHHSPADTTPPTYPDFFDFGIDTL